MPKTDIWQQEFEPSGVQPEQNMIMLSVEDIPVPADFGTKLPARIIRLKPDGWSGNHRHLARQVYVALSDGLYIVWRDSAGQIHEKSMTAELNKFLAFGLPPYMPHLVENRSGTAATLYELLEVNDGSLEPLEGKDSLRQLK